MRRPKRPCKTGKRREKVHTIEFQLRYADKRWTTHQLLIPATNRARAIAAAEKIVQRDYIRVNGKFQAREFHETVESSTEK
jgi:hypothetical protein